MVGALVVGALVVDALVGAGRWGFGRPLLGVVPMANKLSAY